MVESLVACGSCNPGILLGDEMMTVGKRNKNWDIFGMASKQKQQTNTEHDALEHVSPASNMASFWCFHW